MRSRRERMGLLWKDKNAEGDGRYQNVEYERKFSSIALFLWDLGTTLKFMHVVAVVFVLQFNAVALHSFSEI